MWPKKKGLNVLTGDDFHTCVPHSKAQIYVEGSGDHMPNLKLFPGYE